MSQLMLLATKMRNQKHSENEIKSVTIEKVEVKVERGLSRQGYEKVRYPWKQWFENDTFKLVKGVDYHCRTYTMDQMIRTRATKDNKRVSIKIAEDGMSLRVRVYDR